MYLDYNELVKNYNDNLENNLRGFTGGPGFLETWTYDTDDIRSINEIIDLAIEARHEVLKINVSDTTILDKVECGGYKKGYVLVDNICVHYYSENALRYLDSIRAFAIRFGYQKDMRIVGLKDRVLTLDYDPDPKYPPLHLGLIKIENALNQDWDRKIDIQTLNVEDRNKRDKK